jgi:HAD superfamily hydrolase (TIGR01509 family)
MSKAILFDLDGVLVDACDWHYEALNAALIMKQKQPIPRDLHLTVYNGLPTHVKLNMLGISDDEAKDINRLKQLYTLSTITEHAKIMPEKIEMHKHIKACGYKIACVTNSIRETAKEMLKATGQLEYMDLLITNEDVKNNKPAPDCYNIAIQKLNADPLETLIVEDSPKGIAAAKASNAARCIEVKNTTEVNINTISPLIRNS